MKLLPVVIGGALLAGACASSSRDIATSYVSPLQYQSYTCPQISEEVSRVASRAGELAGQQDRKATSDAVMTGVGLILFWPALFFIKGDGATAQEYGRLKGEYEALERAATVKNCGINFRSTTAKA